MASEKSIRVVGYSLFFLGKDLLEFEFVFRKDTTNLFKIFSSRS